MLVVVIATVGENTVGFCAWPAGLPSIGRLVKRSSINGSSCVTSLRLPAGQRDSERDAARVDKQMVL